MDRRKDDTPTPAQRKTYESPRLAEIGTLLELTAGAAGANPDSAFLGSGAG